MSTRGIRGNYDHIRCPVCGVSWCAPIPLRAHGADCPRDAYRPPVRCNQAGEDVTGTPARWGFDDEFFPAGSHASVALAAAPRPAAAKGGAMVLVVRSPEVG
jgi:hypothetical protein